jgi:hypothetical protein
MCHILYKEIIYIVKDYIYIEACEIILLNMKKYDIYLIWSKDCDGNILRYYGSTANFIKRKSEHKKNYERWIEAGRPINNYKKCSSVHIIDKGDWKMEKIEEVIGERWEARKKEGEYQKNNDCVNVRKELRTKKERYNDNRGEILKKCKEYRLAHREEILKKNKEYRLAQREEILKKNKEYRLAHRDEILKKSKEYRLAHREEILKKNKEYRLAHRDEILKKSKEYYNLNKEAISEKNKEKIICDYV